MRFTNPYLFLCLVFGAVFANAQSDERIRTLFAIGKWEEVLELAVLASTDVSLMRIEALVRLHEYDRANESARVLLPTLTPKEQQHLSLEMMRAAEQNDDISSFFYFDRIFAQSNQVETDELCYLRGRMHFLARDYDKSNDQLLRVSLQSEYGIRAQYLLATTELMRNQREFALTRFAKLSDVEAFGARDLRVIRLARSAHARLLVQKGRYQEALRVFNKNQDSDDDLLERAWTTMTVGDDFLDHSLTLAAVEYSSALRLVAAMPKYELGSDKAFRKSLLQAELMLRIGNEDEAISRFEAVIKETHELSEAKRTLGISWIVEQPEMKQINYQIAQTEKAIKDVRALMARAKGANQQQSIMQLSEELRKLEKVAADLGEMKSSLLGDLVPRWKSHLNLFADSARVGMFSSRLRRNARFDTEIQRLEQQKAAELEAVGAAP